MRFIKYWSGIEMLPTLDSITVDFFLTLEDCLYSEAPSSPLMTFLSTLRDSNLSLEKFPLYQAWITSAADLSSKLAERKAFLLIIDMIPLLTNWLGPGTHTCL